MDAECTTVIFWETVRSGGDQPLRSGSARRLQDRVSAVSEFAIGEPTLDEAFLALTRRSIDPPRRSNSFFYRTERGFSGIPEDDWILAALPKTGEASAG
jgi:hypothetical protein